MILQIGDEILRRKADVVAEDEFGTEDFQKDLLRAVSYLDESAVGIAAPQIGISKRWFIWRQGLFARVMVNPKIVRRSKKIIAGYESCLSIPGIGFPVERSHWVDLKVSCESGRNYRARFEGWDARIVQHEIDHLDGVLVVDRAMEDVEWLYPI